MVLCVVMIIPVVVVLTEAAHGWIEALNEDEGPDTENAEDGDDEVEEQAEEVDDNPDTEANDDDEGSCCIVPAFSFASFSSSTLIGCSSVSASSSRFASSSA